MASKLWINPGQAITFTATGGDYAFTLDDLAGLTGRQSAKANLGPAPRSNRYQVRMNIEWKSADVATVGETVELYLKTYDESGNIGLNDDADGDAALSAEDKLRNLIPVLTIQCDEAVADTSQVGEAVVEIDARYIAWVVYNRAATGNLDSTANTNQVIMTPFPYEAQ